tara:strand:- start:242 stop:493 length:252 start_codon:yes stop_codon:yes gene_type:complete
MKNLKYKFSDIQDYCERPMALDNGAVSYLFSLLDGRMTISELNKEIKDFVKEEIETSERQVRIQENRDYAIQENRISDDPEIK